MEDPIFLHESRKHSTYVLRQGIYFWKFSDITKILRHLQMRQCLKQTSTCYRKKMGIILIGRAPISLRDICRY